ncbi:MAG: TIGR04086 family membrane protein [Solirubrobacterales bacterium]|nr:TIGR04086 family membrane protein [Solirubrobacterales bacterium]
MKDRTMAVARLLESKHAVTGLVAVALLVTALNYGGYGNQYTSELGLVTWTVLLVGLGTTVLPRSKVNRAGIAAIVLILLLMGLTALSITWAPDTGRAFSQTILLLGVAGVFLLAIFTSRKGEGRAWLWGLTIGLGLIVLLAALSRYLPLIGNDAELSRNLGPIMSGRLAWPLGYWNAMGTVAVMFILLVLWHGAHDPRERVRRIAIGVIPAAFAVLYLTASRGGLAALSIGLIMLIAFGPDRRRLASSALLALLAGLPVVLLVSNLGAVAHADDGTTATLQGFLFMGASLLACYLTWRYLPAATQKAKQFHPERRTVLISVSVLAVLLFGLLIASNPIDRVSEFTAIPFGGVDRSEDQAFAAEHLLSANGNGRWQLWDAALEAFGTQPLHGIGAGGFEFYFREFGDYWMKTVDTHSLPFMILSELGLLGFLAFLGFIGVVIRQAVVRLRSSSPNNSLDQTQRNEMVAFLTVLAVGSFSLLFDWTGQFPVVFGTLMVCAAMLVGPAYSRGVTEEEKTWSPVRLTVTAGLILLAGAAIFFANRSYQAASSLEASRSATSDGDGTLAVRKAEQAVSALPWSGETWARLASVHQDLGDDGDALAAATVATEKSPKDEDVWLLRANIESGLGLNTSWANSMVTALLLNPNSAYWNDQRVHTMLSRADGNPDYGLEYVFNLAAQKTGQADQAESPSD